MFQKFVGAALLLLPFSVFAQVAPATQGGGHSLSAGAEYSNFQPDWGPNRLSGIAVFGDLDNIFLHNLGIEGEARWLHFQEYHGQKEEHYLLGPRYRFVRFHQISGYGKVLFGGGWITYPYGIGSGSYFAYAPGGTAEYRLTHHFILRGDYEYQIWPSAPGLAFTFPNPSHGLTPNGFSVGVAYKIF
ncbi:MAG TPA: outer membrane beta-barrel protein [Alloacidobacterium sp.]|nr:outer membrane beta-barrel protein [Alloacidobacterium sp.]